MGVAAQAAAQRDDVRRQCLALGIDPAHFVRSAPAPAPPVEVWPEHRAAVEVFAACETQWTLLVGMGACAYSGLFYPGVQALVAAWGVKKRHLRRTWEQLQVMERVALPIKNERLNG